MTRNDALALLARLMHRIAPDVDLATIRPDESFTDAADLDSMDFLALVTALHDATGIEVPERDYPQLQTVDGAVGYIAAHAATASH